MKIQAPAAGTPRTARPQRHPHRVSKLIDAALNALARLLVEYLGTSQPVVRSPAAAHGARFLPQASPAAKRQLP